MNLYYLLRLQTTIVFKNLLITQLYAILNYFSIPQQIYAPCAINIPGNVSQQANIPGMPLAKIARKATVLPFATSSGSTAIGNNPLMVLGSHSTTVGFGYNTSSLYRGVSA